MKLDTVVSALLVIFGTLGLIAGCEVRARVESGPREAEAAEVNTRFSVVAVNPRMRVVYDSTFHVVCYVAGLHYDNPVHVECLHLPSH